jgi:hypothetical protein
MDAASIASPVIPLHRRHEQFSATPTPAATAKPKSTLTDAQFDYARIADVYLYILDAAMN